MTPYYQDGAVTIYAGDVQAALPTLPDASVQCVVTSPPYWGLRDYNVVGQLGLEATPEEYVARMVEVFREVRRVLRDDGTLWLNMGDGYAANRVYQVPDSKHVDVGNNHGSTVPPGLKPKDLVGMPWRLAFALQADGWYLRADIIWAKPNPMPESVTDRPTKAHEYIFLLTKRATYYYDAEAVREPAEYGRREIAGGFRSGTQNGDGHRSTVGTTKGADPSTGRNLRSVWTIATQPYPEAHFATFPEDLARRCILAGTSERGACARCGAPWARVVENTRTQDGDVPVTGGWKQDAAGRIGANGVGHWRITTTSTTTGWRPTCECSRHPLATGPDTVPCVILDPFAGSGTALYVAKELGRHAVGVELNPAYIALAARRLVQDVLAFNGTPA